MFYQKWTEDQEKSLMDIFEKTSGTLWDKAKAVNKEWNVKDCPYYTKHLITLVNKYHSLKRIKSQNKQFNNDAGSVNIVHG
jgi:hypothetical protein